MRHGFHTCIYLLFIIYLYIVACQGGRVSIKPVTRAPTMHTLGPFSPLRWTIQKHLARLSTLTHDTVDHNNIYVYKEKVHLMSLGKYLTLWKNALDESPGSTPPYTH